MRFALMRNVLRYRKTRQSNPFRCAPTRRGCAQGVLGPPFVWRFHYFLSVTLNYCSETQPSRRTGTQSNFKPRSMHHKRKRFEQIKNGDLREITPECHFSEVEATSNSLIFSLSASCLYVRIGGKKMSSTQHPWAELSGFLPRSLTKLFVTGGR